MKNAILSLIILIASGCGIKNIPGTYYEDFDENPSVYILNADKTFTYTYTNVNQELKTNGIWRKKGRYIVFNSETKNSSYNSLKSETIDTIEGALALVRDESGKPLKQAQCRFIGKDTVISTTNADGICKAPLNNVNQLQIFLFGYRQQGWTFDSTKNYFECTLSNEPTHIVFSNYKVKIKRNRFVLTRKYRISYIKQF